MLYWIINFVHCFLPDSILEIVLVFVIKGKTGIIDQVDNYRPIALASLCQILEKSVKYFSSYVPPKN